MSTREPVRRTVRSSILPEQLWEFIFRDEVTAKWVGPHTILHPQQSARLRLVDGCGADRTGIVDSVKRSVEPQVAFDLRCRIYSATGAAATELRITVGPDEDGYGSKLQLRESGLPDGDVRERAHRFWGDAASRLKLLLGEVLDRRSNPRQAIIVIHGIGEQHPGDTLNSFVDSGVFELEKDAMEEARWIKPDRLSGSYELRRSVLRASAKHDRPNTEVYELYWAHLIRDTTPGQVFAWLRSILLRKPGSLPQPLRKYWWIGWITVLAFVAAFVISGLIGLSGKGRDNGNPLVWTSLATLLLGAILPAVRSFGRNLTVNRLGDAARYLQATPDNVARREAIRKAGVDLLLRMHDSGRYDRIVIVGHSLGSVVAYDIITFAWQRLYRDHAAPQVARSIKLRQCEKRTVRPGKNSPQVAQHDAWYEHRRNTQRWLVTDLITLGSPLTHADALLADSRPALKRLQRDRVLPTSPPITNPQRPPVGAALTAIPPVRTPDDDHCRFSFEFPYLHAESGKRRTMTTAHHGAPFALTRWSNLYFKAGVISGDPVGGPLAPLFGDWIKDVTLAAPARGLLRFAHTKYFTRGDASPNEGAGGVGFEANEHIQKLTEALALNCRTELYRLAKDMPADQFLRRNRD